MPDHETTSSHSPELEARLDRMLAFDSPPQDDRFVVDVMSQVRKERQSRRWILAGSGAVGAAFGLAGALMLSDSVGALVRGSLETAGPLLVGLSAAAALGGLAWLLYDDSSLIN